MGVQPRGDLPLAPQVACALLWPTAPDAAGGARLAPHCRLSACCGLCTNPGLSAVPRVLLCNSASPGGGGDGGGSARPPVK